MIYRQIKGDAINEYEGTPEEIKAMLKAECTHTGLYDHIAMNTGNGVESVCLRCREKSVATDVKNAIGTFFKVHSDLLKH